MNFFEWIGIKTAMAFSRTGRWLVSEKVLNWLIEAILAMVIAFCIVWIFMLALAKWDYLPLINLP